MARDLKKHEGVVRLERRKLRRPKRVTPKARINRALGGDF